MQVTCSAELWNRLLRLLEPAGKPVVEFWPEGVYVATINPERTVAVELFLSPRLFKTYEVDRPVFARIDPFKAFVEIWLDLIKASERFSTELEGYVPLKLEVSGRDVLLGGVKIGEVVDELPPEREDARGAIEWLASAGANRTRMDVQDLLVDMRNKRAVLAWSENDARLYVADEKLKEVYTDVLPVSGSTSVAQPGASVHEADPLYRLVSLASEFVRAIPRGEEAEAVAKSVELRSPPGGGPLLAVWSDPNTDSVAAVAVARRILTPEQERKVTELLEALRTPALRVSLPLGAWRTLAEVLEPYKGKKTSVILDPREAVSVILDPVEGMTIRALSKERTAALNLTIPPEAFTEFRVGRRSYALLSPAKLGEVLKKRKSDGVLTMTSSDSVLRLDGEEVGVYKHHDASELLDLSVAELRREIETRAFLNKVIVRASDLAKFINRLKHIASLSRPRFVASWKKGERPLIAAAFDEGYLWYDADFLGQEYSGDAATVYPPEDVLAALPPVLLRANERVTLYWGKEVPLFVEADYLPGIGKVRYASAAAPDAESTVGERFGERIEEIRSASPYVTTTADRLQVFLRLASLTGSMTLTERGLETSLWRAYVLLINYIIETPHSTKTFLV